MRVPLLLLVLAFTALEARWFGGVSGLRVWLIIVGPMLGGLVVVCLLVAIHDAIVRVLSSQNDEMTVYASRHQVKR